MLFMGRSFLADGHPLGPDDARDRPYWYIWSVLPAIMGWLAIVMLEIKISLLALAIALPLVWSASLQGLIPAWCMQMRRPYRFWQPFAPPAASGAFLGTGAQHNYITADH